MRFNAASFVFAVLASAPVAADPAPPPQASREGQSAIATIEARILGIEEDHLVLDIGARSGVKVGQNAELFRPLKLKNPATGRTVEDRYRIGALKVTEVLDVMSFAAPEGEARRPPAPGDIVVLRVERPSPKPLLVAEAAKPAGSAAAAAAPSVTPDSAKVTALIESLYGTTLEQRIQKMETWLRDNPSNAYAPAIHEELSLLRASAASPQSRSEAGETPRTALPPPDLDPPRAARFMPPEAGLAGAALEIGVELEGELRGAVLHTRNASEVAYVSTPMRSAGARFWVATVPGERVTAPALEYFIEAVRPDGTAQPVVGSPDLPLRIRTPEPPKPAPALAHRSIASVYTDYADYNRLIGNDRVWQTEGFFGMRFADRGVRALRTGFGVYRGRGGSIEELDVQNLPPRAVGLTYGHLEGEFGVSETVSLIGRLILGLGEDGVSGGGQAHVRIGSDLDTNLLVGGEVLGDIGLRGSAQLELWPKGTYPIMVRTEVTNQPAGVSSRTSDTPATSPTVAQGASEIGGRIILQGGYRIVAPLVLFARVSGGGRTIHHAGPGFGGGVTYEW